MVDQREWPLIATAVLALVGHVWTASPISAAARAARAVALAVTLIAEQICQFAAFLYDWRLPIITGAATAISLLALAKWWLSPLAGAYHLLFRHGASARGLTWNWRKFLCGVAPLDHIDLGELTTLYGRCIGDAEESNESKVLVTRACIRNGLKPDDVLPFSEYTPRLTAFNWAIVRMEWGVVREWLQLSAPCMASNEYGLSPFYFVSTRDPPDAVMLEIINRTDDETLNHPGMRIDRQHPAFCLVFNFQHWALLQVLTAAKDDGSGLRLETLCNPHGHSGPVTLLEHSVSCQNHTATALIQRALERRRRYHEQMPNTLCGALQCLTDVQPELVAYVQDYAAPVPLTGYTAAAAPVS